MAIGYRSLLAIDGDHSQTQKYVMEQFYAWLKNDPIQSPRRFNVDAMEMNAVTVFTPNSEIVLAEHHFQDGARSVRARLVESKESDNREERWISTLTMHFPGKPEKPTLIRFEVDAPVDEAYEQSMGLRKAKWVGTPNFIKRLVEVLEVRDNGIRLTSGPSVFQIEDCASLVRALENPLRKCTIIVAGSRSDIPMQKWTKTVASVTKDTIGTAAVFVLTPEATDEFNQIVGNAHSVWPNSIRSYVPGFNSGSELNARIHPVIRYSRIQQEDVKKLSRSIGTLTRKALISSPLTRDILRIDSVLNELENQLLISGKRIDITAPKFTESTILESPDLESLAQDLATNVVEQKLPEQVSMYLSYFELVRAALQVDQLTPESILDIADRLARGNLVSERLVAATHQISDLEIQRDLLQVEIDDEIINHAETYSEKIKLEERVSYLRRELTQTNRGGNAWLDISDEDRFRVPENFEDLLLSISNLKFVDFTGDSEQTLALEEANLGARSGKVWEALLALEDYVRAKEDGAFASGGFTEYLRHTPSAYRSISVQKYAPTESESTENRADLRSERLFPVPKLVNTRGEEKMFAHIKIGVGLRIHFLDDSARSGKIYVGYIGRHLSTVGTN